MDEALRDIAETLVLENPRFIVGAALLLQQLPLPLRAAVGLPLTPLAQYCDTVAVAAALPCGPP